MRDLNEQVVCLRRLLETSEDTVLVMCECTAVSCSLTLSLSPEEYERIRELAHAVRRQARPRTEGR